MSSNLVIVAIPEENDRVWKVSSEKVPHLTILHLGDSENVSNLDSIILFVEHAARTSLKKFYLPVERRGELGADKADVLFFRKGRYDFKAVRDFRSLLLKDSNIKSAYDAASQFELPAEVGEAGQAWIPHLTLGYPDSPAKTIPDDHISNFYDVCFDKIAIWPDDFEGPDYQLKDYWEEFDEMEIPMDVAMSDIQHYGTKGMKWGVRKSVASEGGKREGIQKFLDPQGHKLEDDVVKTWIGVLVPVVAPFTWPAQIRLVRGGARGIQAKAVDRQEKKFEKKAMSPQNFVAIHNGSIEKSNRDIGIINSKPQYKNVNFNAPENAKLKKTYEDEVVKSMQDSYRQSANSLTNKANTRHLDLEFKNDGLDFMIHAREGAGTPMAERVKHAAEDDVEVIVEITGKIKRNATGHIIGLDFDHLETDSAQHMVDLGEEFLEHFGVKGMRWGVRREDVGNAARSAGGAVGKAAREVHKFGSDVAFEVHTQPGKDAEGNETRSSATAIVARAGEKEFRSTDLPAIKAKPEHVKASKLKNRLLHPVDPGTRAYRKEVRETYIHRMEKTANSMKNVSGTREYTIRERGGDLPSSKYGWEVSSREARHAAGDEDVIFLEVLMDKDGFITGTKEVKNESSLVQSMDLGVALISDLMEDAGFEHYGVKGMRWGVRREQFVTSVHQRELSKERKRQEKRLPSGIRATPTIGSSRRKKSEVKTKGGQDHPPTQDAIKVAAATQKLKKSGVSALSNQELQEVERRLNLEASVKRLAAGQRSVGEKFVDGLLGRGSKDDRKGFENQAGQKASQHLIKKVSKLAFR